MTMTLDTTTTAAAHWMARLFDQLHDLLHIPQIRTKKARGRRDLLSLDDHLIRDIGLDPSDIRRSDPFENLRHLSTH